MKYFLNNLGGGYCSLDLKERRYGTGLSVCLLSRLPKRGGLRRNRSTSIGGDDRG